MVEIQSIIFYYLYLLFKKATCHIFISKSLHKTVHFVPTLKGCSYVHQTRHTHANLIQQQIHTAPSFPHHTAKSRSSSFSRQSTQARLSHCSVLRSVSTPSLPLTLSTGFGVSRGLSLTQIHRRCPLNKVISVHCSLGPQHNQLFKLLTSSLPRKHPGWIFLS